MEPGPRLPSWLHQHSGIACQSILVVSFSEGIYLYQLHVKLLEPLFTFSRTINFAVPSSCTHIYAFKPQMFFNLSYCSHDCEVNLRSQAFSAE